MEELPGGDSPTPKELPAVEPPEPEPAPEPVRPARKAAAPTKVEKPAPAPAAPAPAKKPAAPAPAARSALTTPARPQAKAAAEPAPKPKAPEKKAPQPAASAAAREAEAHSVEQVEKPSAPIAGPIGRTRTQTHIEDVLSDLFERTQEAFELEQEKGLEFLLDLALEKIPRSRARCSSPTSAATTCRSLRRAGPRPPSSSA
jgi:hypothetical protein